jgi:predicted house-cleaning noncanonical NTP pyrophosphatase (MazG superfamily)
MIEAEGKKAVCRILADEEYLCSARGYTKEELEAEREKKARDRGGFNNRIFLEYVDE